MRLSNNFFIKKSVEISDFESFITKDKLKKYTGFSTLDFLNKTSKIDSKVNLATLRVNELNHRENTTWFSRRFINSLVSQVSEYFNGINSTESLITSDFYQSSYILKRFKVNNIPSRDCSANILSEQLNVEEFDNRFALFHDYLHQKFINENYYQSYYEANFHDVSYIMELKDEFGENWELVYDNVHNFKTIFSLLSSIEKIYCLEEIDSYHTSASTLWIYEYFDLIFTMSYFEYQSTIIDNIQTKHNVNFIQNEKKELTTIAPFLT